MGKYVTFLTLLLLMFSTRNLSAQTAEDVINKYVEAMGGIEKLKSIQSIYMEGLSVMRNGNEAASRIYKVQDKLYRREIDFGMGSFTIIITDKEGWISNPRNGGVFEPLSQEALQNQQGELDISSPLVNFESKGHKVDLLGKENLDGTEAYKIMATLKSGREITYYIDTKNYYLIRQTFKGGGTMFGGGRNRPAGTSADTETKIDYSDYKKTDDGYIFPFTVKLGNMGNSLTYKKIEVNKPIDQKLYKPNGP